MAEAFPYQLVAFLDKEPAIGEAVYGGPNGWYPQIALKRRFNVEGMDEDELQAKIASYCASIAPFAVHIGELVKTERMPVKVLEVESTAELMNFHRGFIEAFEPKLVSRYPERDGDNYYPHITAEYDSQAVIDVAQFTNKQIMINNVWLLKDVDGEDSQAFSRFSLQLES